MMLNSTPLPSAPSVSNRSIAERHLFIILVFTALLVSFAFQGSRALYETSEGRYAESAREMMETGHYLEPTLGYQPHWTKPPLTYWFIALGVKLIGPNEWGLRFFNGVFFFLSVMAITMIGSTLWDRKTGAIAGFIYATSFYPVAGAAVLTTDTLLTFWEIAAVLCFVKAIRRPHANNRKLWVLGMYGCFGLGFITKGPPALLPAIPMILWRLRTKRPAGLAGFTGFLLFILTGLSWYLLVIVRHPDLFSYYVGTEVVGRFTSNAVHNHRWYGPLKVYGPVLLFGGGIWSVYGIRLLLGKRKMLSPAILWKCMGESRPLFFMVSWIVSALFVFSLAKSRLPLYILPLHTPVTLLIARGMAADPKRPLNIRKVLGIAMISAILLVCLKGAAAYYPSSHDMKRLDALCHTAGGNDMQVAVYSRFTLYGLQYYLNGRLERIAYPGLKAPADTTLEEVIDKLDGNTSGPKKLLVSSHKESGSLKQTLQASGHTFEEIEHGKWDLFIMTGSKAGEAAPLDRKEPVSSAIQPVTFMSRRATKTSPAINTAAISMCFSQNDKPFPSI